MRLTKFKLRQRERLKHALSDVTCRSSQEKEKTIQEIEKKHHQDLADFTLLDNEKVYNLKLGSKIRYINHFDKLRFGYLAKIIRNSDVRKVKLQLFLKGFKQGEYISRLWEITYGENKIYYKEKKNKNEKLRDIFISQLQYFKMLNKNNENEESDSDTDLDELIEKYKK